MSKRSGILAFALAAGLGLAGLAVSAAHGQRFTAFSVRVAARGFAVLLQPRQQACQTPVMVSAPTGGVEVWLYSGPVPGPEVGVTVSDARGGGLLAVGGIPPTPPETTPPKGFPSPISRSTRFDATVPAGKRIMICFQNLGKTAVALMGSGGPSDTSGAITSPAQSRGQAIALLFLRPHPQSLFSMLPTVFRRAELFRPTWVGAWTFWLLACALLGSFALGAVAIARASAADAKGP
jgi:hypothetical protein